MAQVGVPQAAIAGIDHDGRRYIAKDGILTVPDRVAASLIKHDECFPVSNQPRGVDGFRCGCGFNGYFRVCGRCGALNERISS